MRLTVVGPLKGTQGQDGLNVEAFLEEVAFELLEGGKHVLAGTPVHSL